MKQRIVPRIVALGARPEFWLACLLVWLLLSAGRSLGTPWARAALTEMLRWGAGIGLMLTLGVALRRVRAAAQAAAAAGLMALAGVWDGFSSEQGRLVGPYHDHQLYGSALLILLPLPVALALSAREAVWRRGATAIAGACAVCLLLSETRSAWAGLPAAALVFAGLWLFRSGQSVRQGRTVLVSALVLLGGLALLWTLSSPADLRGRVAQRAATLSALGTDESWQGRLTAWRGTARLIETEPLAGVGLGRYPGAQRFWTHAGAALLPTARPSLSEQAHCFYLQTASEIGVIGLGLYLAALLALACRCLRVLRAARGRRMGRRDALLIAVLSLIAGQSVDALASPSWQFAETSLLFWALLGIGLAALRRDEAERAPALAVPPLHRPWRLAVSGAAAVALAANFVPIGLLSPVEAYSSPATWSYNYCVLSPLTASAHPGDTVTYTLTAHYTTPTSSDQTVDVTQDSTTVYTGINSATSYNTQFGKNSTTKNVFTVPSVSNGYKITIGASFKDTRINAVQRNAQQTGTLTVISP